MKKGQIYMMIAGIIILALSTLASIGIYTSLPIEKEQAELSNTEAMIHNINREIERREMDTIRASVGWTIRSLEAPKSRILFSSGSVAAMSVLIMVSL